MTWSENSLQRHMNIPASYLVLVNDAGQVLLLRRFNTGYKDGMYSLVAGHVDEGETFTDALIREAKEEAGVVVDPAKVEVAHIMHRKSDTDGSERVDIFFIVREWSGEIVNCEPGKCDELSWFEFDSLPENVIEYIRVALESIRDGVQYSEVGWSNK
ncbi:MAG: hypothetical protein BroJett025_08620 [Patescibacteria group bacterium]|nr:MAG: hypothetical protein BroJett025_08620 [Patescibacteria group bacterium]